MTHIPTVITYASIVQMTSQYCTRVTHVLFFSLYCNAEVLPYPRCLLHAHCLTDTFVSVAHQHWGGSHTWWLMKPRKGRPKRPEKACGREKSLTTLIVYGADFDKPAVKTPAWKDVCGTPNGVISGFHLWPEGQRVWGPRLTPMWISPILPF